MADTDVMTVREVAEYLKVKERTIYRLVARGDIPAFKVGGSWRFRKGEIDQWTESNAIGPNDTGEKADQDE
ncbi:MAG: helix-turn-helix domain-containing protein [Hyphomicrobiales bacterium]